MQSFQLPNRRLGVFFRREPGEDVQSEFWKIISHFLSMVI